MSAAHVWTVYQLEPLPSILMAHVQLFCWKTAPKFTGA